MHNYCLDQIMSDKSSERKKDSTPEAFVKQPSADNEAIGLPHNPSKSPEEEEKWRRTGSSSSSSSSSKSKSISQEQETLTQLYLF